MNDYSMLLKQNGEAACVIRNYDVYIRPFESVPPFHAYAEGEAERSLESWKEIHTKFFLPRLELIDKALKAESLIVCEKFAVEYTAEAGREKRDELFFVEPSMTYAEEIRFYREEMLVAESSFDGCFSMKRMPDPQEYADYCTGWANPSRPLDEKDMLHRCWQKQKIISRLLDFQRFTLVVYLRMKQVGEQFLLMVENT